MSVCVLAKWNTFIIKIQFIFIFKLQNSFSFHRFQQKKCNFFLFKKHFLEFMTLISVCSSLSFPLTSIRQTIKLLKILQNEKVIQKSFGVHSQKQQTNMDLIQSYSDEENSSSSDEIKIKQEYAAPNMDGDYEAEDVPSKVSGFDALGNVPIDRLMIAKATIAAQKSINQRKQLAPGFSVWCADIDKETRMYLGSIKVLQKHTILNSMDHFIR